jgi:ectoine hydroxylase-related dioxygenase (phytanoyl-CoA dioxygenase family)
VALNLASAERTDLYEMYDELFGGNANQDAAKTLEELDTIQMEADYSDLSPKGKAIFHFLQVKYSLLGLWKDKNSFSERISNIDGEAGVPLVGDRSHERDGSGFLFEKERQFFSKFGILGPYPSEFEGERIERLLYISKKFYELSGGLPSIPFIHFLDDEILSLAFDEEILKRVRSVLGDDIDLVRSTLHVKEPGNSAREKVTPWHFDSDITRGINVWIGLTDSKIVNGCMRMNPGSFVVNREFSYVELLGEQMHLVSTLPKEERRTLLAKFAQVATNNETAKRLGLVVTSVDGLHRKIALKNAKARELLTRNGTALLESKKGDYFIFDFQNHHGSLPNLSEDFRVAVSFRYTIPGEPVLDTLFMQTMKSEDRYRHNDFLRQSARLIRMLGEKASNHIPFIKIAGDTPRENASLYWSPEDLVALRKELDMSLEGFRPASGVTREDSDWTSPSDSHV